MFVRAVDHGQAALVKPLQPGGNAGETRVEPALPLGHVGAPLVVGRAECRAETAAFLDVFPLDLRVERGQAGGGLFFRGGFERAGGGQLGGGAADDWKGNGESRQPQG